MMKHMSVASIKLQAGVLVVASSSTMRPWETSGNATTPQSGRLGKASLLYGGSGEFRSENHLAFEPMVLLDQQSSELRGRVGL